MEQAERDFRYTMQHLGDILMDSMDDLLKGVKASFRGVRLTYEIQCLRGKRKKIIYKIGERVVKIRKSDSAVSVTTDDEAIGLFSEFDRIEARLDADIMERESRINRWGFVNESAD